MFEYFINGRYINNKALKNLILNRNETILFKSDNESKPYTEISYDDLINNFISLVKNKEDENLDINICSSLLLLKKEHLLPFLLILYENKNDDKKASQIIEMFLTASDYETREEILLSLLTEVEKNE